MRIGIDARLWTQTGVGRYIRNLVNELVSLDKKNEYVIYLRKNEYSKFNPPKDRWKKRLLDVPWHTFSEQMKVPFELKRDKLDVVHFPYFNVPIFYDRPFLLTIHDLIVDHFDTGRASTKSLWFYKIKRMGYRFATKLAIKRAFRISTISETTKKEIIDHYHVTEDEITVTYDGLDSNFKKVAGHLKTRKYFAFPYLLYVGNAYPHKNLERLIFSMKKIKSLGVKLVLAGEDSYFFPRLKKLAEKENLSRNIVFFGEANDENLVNLYTFAKCLVFPSLMEGFGLPNLEAIYCGCLPVVSSIPVFREIWGEKLIYFNPHDISDMAAKIIGVISMDRVKYRRMVADAYKIAEKFSWEVTARQTLKLYEEIASCQDND